MSRFLGFAFQLIDCKHNDFIEEMIKYLQWLFSLRQTRFFRLSKRLVIYCNLFMIFLLFFSFRRSLSRRLAETRKKQESTGNFKTCLCTCWRIEWQSSSQRREIYCILICELISWLFRWALTYPPNNRPDLVIKSWSWYDRDYVLTNNEATENKLTTIIPFFPSGCSFLRLALLYGVMPRKFNAVCGRTSRKISINKREKEKGKKVWIFPIIKTQCSDGVGKMFFFRFSFFLLMN